MFPRPFFLLYLCIICFLLNDLRALFCGKGVFLREIAGIWREITLKWIYTRAHDHETMWQLTKSQIQKEKKWAVRCAIFSAYSFVLFSSVCTLCIPSLFFLRCIFSYMFYWVLNCSYFCWFYHVIISFVIVPSSVSEFLVFFSPGSFTTKSFLSNTQVLCSSTQPKSRNQNQVVSFWIDPQIFMSLLMWLEKPNLFYGSFYNFYDWFKIVVESHLFPRFPLFWGSILAVKFVKFCLFEIFSNIMFFTFYKAARRDGSVSRSRKIAVIFVFHHRFPS